jgi:hypothetical protein
MTICGGYFSNSFTHVQPKESVGTQQQQDIVSEMLHLGFVSRGTFEDKKQQHIEWTEQSQYNNTFAHIQYHRVMFMGKIYFIHQTQYYNHNYNDHRSPGYTQVYIKDDETGENLGTYIMDTKEYIKDIKTLEIKERVS